MRPWWTGEAVINYRNVGGSDVVAPLLSISADNARFRVFGEEQFTESSLQFLGINDTGATGILPAGASGSFTVAFQPTENISEIDFTVSTVDADEVVDWSALKESAKPDNIPNAAWDEIWDNFTDSVDSTAGGYQAVLAENATRLGQLGERTRDVSKLLAFELQQSSDYQAITRRYTIGSLGRGQTFLGDLQLTADVEGNVTIQNGPAQRTFVLQSDGSYQAESGDNSTLVAVGGSYQLREQSGTVSAFSVEGRLDYIEDANGNRVFATYTDQQLTSLSDSNGGELAFSYQNGRIINVEDEVGRTTTYTYDDSDEYVTTVTDSSGTTTYTYNDNGAIETITDPEDTAVAFDYDEQGRLSEQSVDDQEAISYSYDSAGGLTITEATGQGTTQILLNERGQIGQLADAVGRAVQYRYDDEGNLTRVIGPNSTTASFVYDDEGQLTSQTDANGLRTQFSYEGEFGQLETVTDARGNELRYEYDSRGNLSKILYEDDSSETFEYNDAGEVEKYNNRRGQEITYRYENGQIVDKTVGGDTSITYSYDSRGNLERVINGQSETQMAYDASDRLEKITYPTGRFLEFDYDNADRRTRLADQDGNVVNYAYDGAGRLKMLVDGSDALIVDYGYDASGRLAREDKGNGTYSTYDYLPTGELESLVHFAPDGSVNARFDYEYDLLGRQEQMVTLDGTWQYGYDSVGQLTSAIFVSTNEEIPNQNLTYVYDAAGNRIRTIENGLTVEYVTNTLNQYERVGDTTYTYDDDGNLAGKTDESGTTVYEYNSDNRLVKVTAPGDVVTEYEYGVFGDRVATIHEGDRTEYLIDPFGLGDVVGEYDSEGNLVSIYSHGIGIEHQLSEDGSKYFDFDAVGSTVGISEDRGEYINSYSYLPFGKELYEVEGISNSFEFASQLGVMEEANNLIFMRNRFYSGHTGKFHSEDPLGISSGDINLSRYSRNSPNNLIDPDGLSSRSSSSRNPRWRPYADKWYKTPWLFHCGFDGYVENRKPTLSNPQDEFFVDPFYNTEVTRYHEYSGCGGSPNQYDSSDSFEHTWYDEGGIFNKGRESFRDSRRYFMDQNPWSARWLGESFVSSIGEGIFRAYDIAEYIYDNSLIVPTIASGITAVARAIDPNDIVGPNGFGDAGWVTLDNELPYTVRFENDPDRGATAPAVFVTITHQLDSDLDWDTFELGNFGFNNLNVDVPEGRQNYSTQVQVPNVDDYFVDFEATFDPLTGDATWSLRTLDPRTGSFPNDAFLGFLPVNGDNNEGEGYVNYTIQPQTDLSTGTEITAIAEITFDTNAPISTDEENPAPLNTIDIDAPTSSVLALPITTVTSSFAVSWSGTDSGSGIQSYDVYVSVDDAPFVLWLDDTTETSGTYSGDNGSQYSFYSTARDNVGQSQVTPVAAQAVTTVDTSVAPFVLATNTGLSLNEEEVALITSQLLNVGGIEDRAAEVIYTLKSLPSNGYLQLGEAQLSISDTFTQEDINDDRVEYIHDGSETVDDMFSFAVGLGNTSFLIEADFQITVNPVNDVPVLANAIADQTASQDSEFSFVIALDTFIDADLSDSLSYSATLANGEALPGWLTFDSSSQTFTGTPDASHIGPLDIKVTATDTANATAEDQFSLTIVSSTEEPSTSGQIKPVGESRVVEVTELGSNSTLSLQLNQISIDSISELLVFTTDSSGENRIQIASFSLLEAGQLPSAYAPSFSLDNQQLSNNELLQFELVQKGVARTAVPTVYNQGQIELDFGNGTQLTASITEQTSTQNILLNDAAAIDISNETGSLSVDFTVYREASFDNTVGLYRMDAADGSVRDSLTGNTLRPGEAGYKEVALSKQLDIKLTGQNGRVSTFSSEIVGGGFLGTFLIADGSDVDVNNIYFGHAGANADANDHVKMLGNNTFGFEDLVGLGDSDFNDTVVQFSIA